MTKRTIIYLHSAELSQASWVVSDEEEIESSVLRGHLSDLPLDDKKNEITVILPACDILLTDVSLPKLNRQRLLQALPFALEEKLTDDVSDLHFAIETHPTSETVSVAIVARKKMDEWIALFKQYEIFPVHFYSAVFALPSVEKAWSVLILSEASTLRQNVYQGFHSEPNNLALFTELAIQTAPEKPECIHVYSTLTTPLNLSLQSILLNEIHLPEQNWLETIPAWIKPSLSINLLQGQYEPRRKASGTKKLWLYAACATLIWISLAFFSNLVSFFILHHEASNIDKEINHIYQANFPQSNSVIAPRERMENKLSSLDDQANKNYFLVLLAKTGSELAKTTQIQLKNLEFQDNQLTLEVTANKFDDLDHFAHVLTIQGLDVKEQNAAVAGELVKASLLIRRGSP